MKSLAIVSKVSDLLITETTYLSYAISDLLKEYLDWDRSGLLKEYVNEVSHKWLQLKIILGIFWPRVVAIKNNTWDFFAKNGCNRK